MEFNSTMSNVMNLGTKSKNLLEHRGCSVTSGRVGEKLVYVS